MDRPFMLTGECFADVVPCQISKKFTQEFVGLLKSFDALWSQIRFFNTDICGQISQNLEQEQLFYNDARNKAVKRKGACDELRHGTNNNFTARLFRLIARLGYLQSRMRVAVKNEIDQKLYELLGDILVFSPAEYTDIDDEIDAVLPKNPNQMHYDRYKHLSNGFKIDYLMDTYGALLIDLDIHSNLINFLQLYNGTFCVANKPDPVITNLHKQVHFTKSAETKTVLDSALFEPYISRLRAVTTRRKTKRSMAFRGGGSAAIVSNANEGIQRTDTVDPGKKLHMHLQQITACMADERKFKIYNPSERLNFIHAHKIKSSRTNDNLHNMREYLMHTILKIAFILNAKLIQIDPDNNFEGMNLYGDFRLT